MTPKRKKVWNKSQGHCWYCGCELKIGWHIDHFKPLGRNPDKTVSNPENDNEDNLVPACVSCNIMKSDMTIEKFRKLISNFVNRLNRDVTVYGHAKRYGLIKETGQEVVFWFERSNRNELTNDETNHIRPRK